MKIAHWSYNKTAHGEMNPSDLIKRPDIMFAISLSVCAHIRNMIKKLIIPAEALNLKSTKKESAICSLSILCMFLLVF